MNSIPNMENTEQYRPKSNGEVQFFIQTLLGGRSFSGTLMVEGGGDWMTSSDCEWLDLDENQIFVQFSPQLELFPGCLSNFPDLIFFLCAMSNEYSFVFESQKTRWIWLRPYKACYAMIQHQAHQRLRIVYHKYCSLCVAFLCWQKVLKNLFETDTIRFVALEWVPWTTKEFLWMTGRFNILSEGFERENEQKGRIKVIRYKKGLSNSYSLISSNSHLIP